MVAFLLSIVNMVIGAFAVMNMWNWFIAPLGVTTISAIHAYGINLFVTFLTVQILDEHTRKKTEDELLQTSATATAYILITFFIAYIVHLFM